jgi:glyoxylase-like metal-dependent hydrolase (beta-lactamase superfamily II)
MPISQPVRIELPMDFTYKAVNAYLYLEPYPMLVDCGLSTDDSRAALQRALGEHRLSFSDIEKVVITHPHIDHIGLAADLAASGAEIWVSEIAAAVVQDMQAEGQQRREFLLALLDAHGFDGSFRQQLVRFLDVTRAMRKNLPVESVNVFQLDQPLEMAGLSWEIIRARGHSNRQVCFYQRVTRQLFGADMILHRTPAPVIEQQIEDPAQRERGLPQLINAYSQFRALEIDSAYPGHGEMITDHRSLIERQLIRIEKRKQQCYDLVCQGIDSLPALVNEMYSHLPAMGRMAGVSILLGYLDLLEEQGVVVQRNAAGRIHFVAAG